MLRIRIVLLVITVPRKFLRFSFAVSVGQIWNSVHALMILQWRYGILQDVRKRDHWQVIIAAFYEIQKYGNVLTDKFRSVLPQSENLFTPQISLLYLLLLALHKIWKHNILCTFTQHLFIWVIAKGKFMPALLQDKNLNNSTLVAPNCCMRIWWA